MIKFRSTVRKPLDFEIDGRRYQVPVGGVVELPAAKAFVPKLIGLPLERITHEPEPAPPKPPRRAPVQSDPATVFVDENLLEPDELDDEPEVPPGEGAPPVATDEGDDDPEDDPEESDEDDEEAEEEEDLPPAAEAATQETEEPAPWMVDQKPAAAPQAEQAGHSKRRKRRR